jgi:uncharacterized membrane protein YhiD involved in acid resistance
MSLLRGALLATTLVLAVAPAIGAQTLPAISAQTLPATGAQPDTARADATETPDLDSQVHQLRHALVRLPIAAGLACLLALRPRRRGTPKRQPPVIQTQIILAIVGAVVMLVVGSSLARAFGIVGAAGLVRYRAKIEDPKDAGVMLSTLAVGLAAGVGVYLLALFATIFIMGVLWIIESFEPKATQAFALKVTAKDPAAIKPAIDQLLARHRFKFELRGTSTEELEYEVNLPLERKTDRISENIVKVDPEKITAVEWEQKKEKK